MHVDGQHTSAQGSPAAALTWVEQVWGHEVATVTALTGGVTSTVLLVTATDGADAVLRLMAKDPWRRHGDAMVTRESAVQQLLANTAIPVPRSLAVDPTGAATNDPAHLMTRVPGALELTRSDDDFLLALSRLLDLVHAVDAREARPRTYQSWAHDAKRVDPAWSGRAGLWRKAFHLLKSQEPPAYAPTFIHRDLQLGNLLWTDGVITGVVDWVETSTGPAELEVAHCATYLAVLHGPETAARFLEIHRASSDRRPPPSDEVRYWHVMDIVGYLPDPTKITGTWRPSGVHVPDAVARARLQQHLEAALA